jgi:hypothetical protein
VLYGLFIFAHSEISSTYKYISEKHTNWGLFKSGSQLSDIISTELALHNLDKCQKLIYLNALYQFISTLNTNEILPQYGSPQLLCDKIAIQMKSLIDQSTPEIDELLQMRPNEQFLQDNFSNIASEYTRIKKTAETKIEANDLVEFHSVDKAELLKNNLITLSSRDLVIEFLQTIDHMLKPYNDSANSKAYADTIRYASVVYVMLMIESEKMYQIFSPERSELYKRCQEIINLKHTTQLTALDKSNYYSALGSFIPKVGPQDIDTYCSREGSFPQLAKFFSDMHGVLLEEQSRAYKTLQGSEPHPMLNSFCNVINMTSQFGINIAIGTFAGGLVSLPASQQFITRGAESIGRQYWGFPGAYMARNIGLTVERAAVTSVVKNSLSTATNTVSNAPGNLVYYTLSVPANIFAKITALMSSPPKEKTHENQEYVNTLLSLPDKLLPSNKKRILQHIQLPIMMDQSHEVSQDHKLKL